MDVYIEHIYIYIKLLCCGIRKQIREIEKEIESYLLI